MVLRERYAMIDPPPPYDGADHEESRSLVLMSRKRQARIISNLESHKARAHSA
jgi:hypothetical protein